MFSRCSVQQIQSKGTVVFFCLVRKGCAWNNLFPTFRDFLCRRVINKMWILSDLPLHDLTVLNNTTRVDESAQLFPHILLRWCSLMFGTFCAKPFWLLFGDAYWSDGPRTSRTRLTVPAVSGWCVGETSQPRSPRGWSPPSPSSAARGTSVLLFTAAFLHTAVVVFVLQAPDVLLLILEKWLEKKKKKRPLGTKYSALLHHCGASKKKKKTSAAHRKCKTLRRSQGI